MENSIGLNWLSACQVSGQLVSWNTSSLKAVPTYKNSRLRDFCVGKKFFNHEEFKKTSKLKLQTANLYCFLSAKILKRVCAFSFLFCEDFCTWLAVCQSIRPVFLLHHKVSIHAGNPCDPRIPPFLNLQQWFPKAVHFLIPGICDYVILHSKGILQM